MHPRTYVIHEFWVWNCFIQRGKPATRTIYVCSTVAWQVSSRLADRHPVLFTSFITYSILLKCMSKWKLIDYNGIANLHYYHKSIPTLVSTSGILSTDLVKIDEKSWTSILLWNAQTDSPKICVLTPSTQKSGKVGKTPNRWCHKSGNCPCCSGLSI